jgi:hypothetical protein
MRNERERKHGNLDHSTAHSALEPQGSASLSPTAALRLIDTGRRGRSRRKPRFNANVVLFHEEFDKAYVSRLTTRLEQRHVRRLDGAPLPRPHESA